MKKLLFAALALAACVAPAIRNVPVPVDEVRKAEKPPEPEPVPSAIPIPQRPLVRPAAMSVVSLPDPQKPIVSLRLVFQAGSVDDPKGKEGLHTLTTRVLSEGGTQKLSSSQLLDALYPLAAEMRAETDKELTVWIARVHKDRLDQLLEIFTDTLLNPRFDPKEFDRLKQQSLNSIRTRLRSENDEELGKVALDRLLYEGHPYGHSVWGTVKGLEAITLDDVKAHAKNVFTQDRLIIGLAGPVDKALEDKVRSRLGKLPVSGLSRRELPNAPGVRGKTLILQRDTLSTAGSFGFSTALRRDDPDYFAFAFAMSYFGEHRQMHGVLFTELREKRGLNYGTYAYAEHFRQEGWSSLPMVNSTRTQQDISFWLRPVEPKNAVFATRGITHFLEGLRVAPIPQDKLDVARGFLIGYTRIWEQSDQRRLGYEIDSLLYGTPNFLERYRLALAALTTEQVQQVVRRQISLDRLNFVYVTKDAEGLKKALSSKEGTPISYPTPKPKDVTDLDPLIAKAPLPMHPDAIEIQSAGNFMEQ